MTAKLIEISETIRDHLTKQNVPAHNSDGECVYKADNGNMCAVGCLIKPEHYNKDFEGLGIDEIIVQNAVHASTGLEFTNREFPGKDPVYILLSSWQQYHDEEYQDYVAGVEHFGQPARSPAKFHELVTDPETLGTVRP